MYICVYSYRTLSILGYIYLVKYNEFLHIVYV